MPGQSNALLISPQYLRDNTVINDNVDGQMLQPLILIAQDKYIQPILGSNLYTSILDMYTANTLSGNYLSLTTQYIIPTLLHYSTYEAVPFFNYKFRNKAISKQSSPDSSPADLSELAYVRDNILSTAQFYGQRMIDYLCANSSLFPEYAQGLTNGDGMSPDNGQFFNGVHIPGANRSPDCFKGYGFTTPFRF